MRIAWVALVLGACGGHGSGGGSGSAAATIQRTAEQECSKAYDCMSSFPPDAGFAFEDIFQTSEGACVVFFLDQLDPAAVQAGVDDGRILYNPSDAGVCLNFTATLSCSAFWAQIEGNGPMSPHECDTAFVGTVALGGACESDLDCTSRFCDDSTMTCN